MRQIKCKALKVEIKPWVHQPTTIMHCNEQGCPYFAARATYTEAKDAVESHLQSVHRWGRG
jgi:wobble nucleotide-excising tRNase